MPVQPPRLRADRRASALSALSAAGPRSPVQCCSLSDSRLERAERGERPAGDSSLQPERSRCCSVDRAVRKPRAPSAVKQARGRGVGSGWQAGRHLRKTLAPGHEGHAKQATVRCQASMLFIQPCKQPLQAILSEEVHTAGAPVRRSQPRMQSAVRPCSAGRPDRLPPPGLAKLRQPCGTRTVSTPIKQPGLLLQAKSRQVWLVCHTVCEACCWRKKVGAAASQLESTHLQVEVLQP